MENITINTVENINKDKKRYTLIARDMIDRMSDEKCAECIGLSVAERGTVRAILYREARVLGIKITTSTVGDVLRVCKI